jgi:hypothetical protein
MAKGPTTSGSTSGTTSGTSTTTPYGASAGLLNSLISKAGAIKPSTGTGFSAASGGVPALHDAWGTAKGALTPIAEGEFIGQDNPYLQQLTSTISDLVRNQTGGQAAAAGRSFSPAHMGAVSKNMTDALATPLFNNYWNERNAQTGAISSLLGGAQGYSSGLDASNLSGISTAAGMAGLPYAGLQSLSNLILPIAQGFGTSTQSGKTSGTQTQQTQSDPWQTGIGGGLGLLGLLSMGSGGGLMGSLF